MVPSWYRTARPVGLWVSKAPAVHPNTAWVNISLEPPGYTFVKSCLNWLLRPWCHQQKRKQYLIRLPITQLWSLSFCNFEVFEILHANAYIFVLVCQEHIMDYFDIFETQFNFLRLHNNLEILTCTRIHLFIFISHVFIILAFSHHLFIHLHVWLIGNQTPNSGPAQATTIHFVFWSNR